MSLIDAPTTSAEPCIDLEAVAPADGQRRALARAAVVRHPGLAEITSVMETPRGLRVSYERPSGARPLVPGEPLTADVIVRLLAPVAAGLAQLHDADVTHGAIGIDRLSIRPDGAGVLAPGGGGSGSAADDVHDLVAVLRDLLPSHSVGSDLAHLVVAGTDPEPSVRPSMARVAAILDLARRRLAPPTSPPAQRRAGTCPEPAAWPGETARPSSSAPQSQATPSAKVSRARHAAPAGRPRPRLSWRMTAGLAGVAVAGALAIGAMSSGEAPLVCPAPAAATNPTPPALSPDRSLGRSS